MKPPASFAKLEKPSETPSMTPSATAGAPRLARNAGSIAVAASCPQSEKRLARPIPRTPRVSQRFGEEVVFADSLMFDSRSLIVRDTLGQPNSTEDNVESSRCEPCFNR